MKTPVTCPGLLIALALGCSTPRTNLQSVFLSAPTLVFEREETHATTALGAIQKDTARELSVKLSSLKGTVWVGIASLAWASARVSLNFTRFHLISLNSVKLHFPHLSHELKFENPININRRSSESSAGFQPAVSPISSRQPDYPVTTYRRNPVFQNAHQYDDTIFTIGEALVTEIRQIAGRQDLINRI